MHALPLPLAASGEAATPWLFGGNILAPRAPMTGPGSYAEAVEAMGVTTLRYPGGSLTESFFDVANPDADFAIDNETGARVDFMPISDIMQHGAETGRPVSIVLPTRQQLSETRFDDNGDRLAEVDEAVLRTFVQDVVTGHYGDAEIAGFEIGNEYWGSGRMNAVEYGRVAAEMTRIIDSELAFLAPNHPGAAEIDILVQMGTNFGHSSLDEIYEGVSPPEIVADLNDTYGLDLPPSGRIDWTEVNNRIVMSRFDDLGALEPVDGIVAHVYSRGPDMAHTRSFHLDQIEDTWQEVDPSLEVHVTEWNLRSNANHLEETRDYGLYQAQEMLEQVETFMAEGVDAAQVWPLIQNTPSALSLGMEYSASTPPGEMFALMSESLPGMKMLDFTPGDARDTEYQASGLEVHGFADGTDLLLYVTAPQGAGVVQGGVDLRALVADVGAVEATVLGVAPGQAPGDSASDAVLERLDPDDTYDGGVIDAVLAPGEIMQVRLIGVTPTPGFAEVFADTAPEAAPAEMLAADPMEMASVPEAADLFMPGNDAAPAPPGVAVAQTRAAAPQAAPSADDPDGAAVPPETEDPGVGRATGAADPPDFDSAGPVAPTDPVAPIDPLAAEEPTQAATVPVAPEEAAQEMLRVMGFGQGRSAEPGMDPPDETYLPVATAEVPDEGQEADDDEETGGFDDMGLGWALALLPLIAAAGHLG